MFPIYERELNAAIEIAYAAGEQAKQFICDLKDKKVDFIEKAAGAGPVTALDKKLNDFICGELKQLFPDSRVIGEESVKTETSDFKEGKVFWVDPLDGTKEFIKGIDEWAIMIGLTCEGRPVMGVVYQALADRMYYASKGYGAFKLEGRGTIAVPLCVDPNKNVDDMVAVRSRSHPNANEDELVKALGITKQFLCGSMGLKSCLVAEGKADVYFSLTGLPHFWDSCSPQIIVEEAGAILSRLDGKELIYEGTDTHIRHPIFVCHPRVRDAIIQKSKELKLV